MKPSPETLNRIADAFSRPIPQPAKPMARTKQSWRTLKVGQVLRLRQRWFRPGLDLPPGTEVTVSKTDSLGVDLTHKSEFGTLSLLRWTDPEWKTVFERVRRKRG